MLTVDTNELIRQTAFALLLREHRPITSDELAGASGVRDVSPILDALAEAGQIDRVNGTVTGSAGLSLSDGPHGLRLGSYTFRTWCA